MSDHQAPSENAEVRYEASDAKIWPIAVMGIGIILLGLVAHSICMWMFDAMRASTNRSDPELPALAAKERPKDFGKVPAPQLQVDESKNLNTFRKKEDETLNTYGWVDAQSDMVRIPIEEAMRLLTNPEFAKARGVEAAPAKGGKR